MKKFEYRGCIAYTVSPIGDANARDRIDYGYIEEWKPISAVNEAVAELMALEVETVYLREQFLLDGSHPPVWEVFLVREVVSVTEPAPTLFDMSQI